MIFICSLFAAIMNLIFSQTPLRTNYGFHHSGYHGRNTFRRKKIAEGYLAHLIKFHIEPGHMSAGPTGKNEFKRLKKI